MTYVVEVQTLKEVRREKNSYITYNGVSQLRFCGLLLVSLRAQCKSLAVQG